MSWGELFDRSAAYGVDEAAVRAALAERRADPTESAGSDDDAPEANGP